MIVLIDSGNSRLKVGWLNAGNPAALREPAAIAFDNLDLDALGNWLETLAIRPRLALGVNVAGATRADNIQTALAAHGCPVHWVQARARMLSLENGYRKPAQLGADRWASMLGVVGRLPARHPPVVLVSFGTATTIDTVGPNNAFAGGLILPGLALMRSSLARGTANLPEAEGHITDFPTDTRQAIASGIAAAQAGAVARQWLAARQRYNQIPDIYVAGGGWPEVQHETERLLAQAGAPYGARPKPVPVDNPVLDGLAILASLPNPETL